MQDYFQKNKLKDLNKTISEKKEIIENLKSKVNTLQNEKADLSFEITKLKNTNSW